MTARHEPLRPAALSQAHRCPVTDCTTGCSPGHVVCKPHWRAIPTHQREPLRAAFRARLTDPLGHLAAVAITGHLADLHARRPA